MSNISEFDGIDIAVILPCYNEEQTIAGVVDGFREQLPDATIYVFDNASSDNTISVAQAAGATVYREPRKGKGNVVRRMFADVDADIYLMADGDGTYDSSGAPELIRTLIVERVDMVVARRAGVVEDAGRKGHAFGNRIFNQVYGLLFGREFTDIFSGYRAFSRRFVKSFPAVSGGFEIETEMSVHASQLRIPTAEIELEYGRRPEGSASKLNTFRDGARILRTFALLLKETRPLTFFGAFGAVFAVAAMLISWPLVVTWLDTGLVPRLPTAVLSTGLMISALLMAACGLVLDSVSRSRIEQKRILYLGVPALGTQ
jgi:glycosyltransferase involved in cell wall biosynthesis